MQDSGKIALIMWDSSERREQTFVVDVQDVTRRQKELEAEGYILHECGKAHLYNRKESNKNDTNNATF